MTGDLVKGISGEGVWWDDPTKKRSARRAPEQPTYSEPSSSESRFISVRLSRKSASRRPGEARCLARASVSSPKCSGRNFLAASEHPDRNQVVATRFARTNTAAIMDSDHTASSVMGLMPRLTPSPNRTLILVSTVKVCDAIGDLWTPLLMRVAVKAGAHDLGGNESDGARHGHTSRAWPDYCRSLRINRRVLRVGLTRAVLLRIQKRPHG